MSEHFPFEVIRSRVSLSAVLQHYGLLSSFKSRGDQLVGACPIHGGTHTRQFSITPSRNTWRCFSKKCDRHGDVVDFVAAYDRIPLAEAALRITHWFSLLDPNTKPPRRTTMTDTHTKPSHRVYVTEDISESRGSSRSETLTDAIGLSKSESSSECKSYSESIGVGQSMAIGKGFSSGVTKTYWTKVGAAWPHRDGKGLTVTISPGISVSGRIVLREWTEEQPQSNDDKI